MLLDTSQGQRTSAGMPRPRGRLRRLIGAIVVSCIVLGATAVLAFAGGFLWFVRAVPTQEVALRRDADGIVVLTGGASRIIDAIDLLAAGHGKRLLITGVHRATSSEQIARVTPRHESLLKCCIDLDKSALNTWGNAAETRRWVKDLQFESLIVVTSSYHMPRTMVELGRQLPDVTLIPFPVVSEKLRSEPWWESIATTKLLLTEYVKYMLAQVRTRFDAPPETTDLAGNRGRLGS